MTYFLILAAFDIGLLIGLMWGRIIGRREGRKRGLQEARGILIPRLIKRVRQAHKDGQEWAKRTGFSDN